MVVVEHAYKQVGKTVEIEFIRGLQTAAGKMMFAKLVHPAEAPKNQPTSYSNKTDKSQPKPNGRRAPRVAAPNEPQAPQAAKIPSQPQAAKQNRTKRPNNRRTNPEDSLIELANR